jgi:hypothetical protein
VRVELRVIKGRRGQHLDCTLRKPPKLHQGVVVFQVVIW